MQRVGTILISIIEQKAEEHDYRWNFLCDIVGLSDIKYDSTLSKKQILGPMQRYTAKLNTKID